MENQNIEIFNIEVGVNSPHSKLYFKIEDRIWDVSIKNEKLSFGDGYPHGYYSFLFALRDRSETKGNQCDHWIDGSNLKILDEYNKLLATHLMKTQSVLEKQFFNFAISKPVPAALDNDIQENVDECSENKDSKDEKNNLSVYELLEEQIQNSCFA